MTREQKDRWRTSLPPIPRDASSDSAESGDGALALVPEGIDSNVDVPASESASVIARRDDSPMAQPTSVQPTSVQPTSVQPTSAQNTAAGNPGNRDLARGRATGDGSSLKSRSPTAPNHATNAACPPIAASVLPEEAKASFFSRLLLANSWFVSLVIHLIIFILLSLATYSIPRGADLEIELAQMGDDQPAITLESFESFESSDGSDLDAEMEQLLSASDQSAELDYNSEPTDFVPSVSLNDEMGFDETSADAVASLMSDENRRIGNGNDAEFFGIQATGKDFVFIVDSSGSMSGRRWRNAIRELGDSLGALQENQRFYVIFFDVKTHLMFQGQVKGFRKTKKLKMLNANETNLNKAKRWFARVKLGQKTQPRVSFDYGLSLKPDAIFFLTDGEFNDGTYEFLMEVAAQSDQSPRIHTVAFGNPMAAPTLEEIASRFKGKYQFVR